MVERKLSARTGRAVSGGIPAASRTVLALMALAGAPLAANEPAARHWAFERPSPHDAPAVRDLTWPRTAVDRFVLAGLEARGLQPSPEADRATLLRRVYFDLVGLGPSFEEVQAFLADDSPDAYERVCDRLLASPRHGERWGRHWLDAARYADTKGYVYTDREERRFVHSTAYRDWVIAALNQDLPYDRFLTLQLAADQLQPPGHPDLAAMGFLTLGRRFLGVIHDIIDDRIDTVFRATQALTVSCARCHDHKFDPIPTLDYYALYGVFWGSSERTVELVSTGPAAVPEAERQAYAAELAKRERELAAKLAEKKEAVSSRWRARVAEYLLAVLDVERLPTEEFYAFIGPEDINPVVVRQWHQHIFAERDGPQAVFTLWRELAKAPAEDIAARARSALEPAGAPMHPVVRAAFLAAPPASMQDVARTYGKLLGESQDERLRRVLHGPDSPASVPPGPITEIDWLFDEGTRVDLGKLAARIDALRIDSPGAPRHAVVLVDRPSPPRARVFVRGNPAQRGEEAPRRFLSAVQDAAEGAFEQGSGRLEMARAIASAGNPLTARVMVNRVWLHHFGAGLVRTPSDFGVRAAPPSHPELLDDLAVRFAADGWSLKRLHRELVGSSTYRQSSVASDAAQLADPENRLLGRAHRRRLDFEALRDAIVDAAGELDTRMGGRAVDLFADPQPGRRTVYGLVDRQFLPGTLRVFDMANPDQHTPERHATTVPQQALFLLNSPFIIHHARAAAHRAIGGGDPLAALWRRVLGRLPAAAELASAGEFLHDAAAEAASAPQPAPGAWSYGTGRHDGVRGRIEGFAPLPHFTGEAWQGGPSWPDPALGWARLTAAGGHAGNDLDHAVVRRWTAPRAGLMTLKSSLAHAHKEGDGVRGRIVLARLGSLAEHVVHNQAVAVDLGPLAVEAGDTVDFVVDIHGNLNNDDFTWDPLIRMDGEEWSASGGFAGPHPAPLEPLEALAQALLVSNEMAFVD